MSEIRKVVLAGASGGLGTHVLKALLQAGFQVTAFVRSQKSSFDPAVKVLEVDYTSVESLAAALQGQDAVVSTVGTMARDAQKVLIDAAVAAGVERFIPSDYGSCTTNPELKDLPIYSNLAGIQQYLIQKSKIGNLSYTILASGAFLDYIVKTPLLLDFEKHAATLIDDGNNRVSATWMAQIGTAVAGILKHPNETKDRTVYVSEVIVTQTKLLDIARKFRPEVEWKVSSAKSSVMLPEALDAIATGGFSMPVVMKMLSATALAGDRYGAAFDKTDNELLGIATLSDDELERLVAESLK